MPISYALDQIFYALPLSKKTNMNYSPTHDFLAIRHKFCSGMSLKEATTYLFFIGYRQWLLIISAR